MLFCHLFTIVSQHQSISQNNLMVFELFIPFFEPGVPTRPKSAKYKNKIGQFAGKYQILVIVPRQIYKYVLIKLHLMSVPVFRWVSARHYRFEGKEKTGTHLIIKI